MKCGRCDGKGVLPDMFDCPACHGSGEVPADDDDVVCVVCREGIPVHEVYFKVQVLSGVVTVCRRCGPPPFMEVL